MAKKKKQLDLSEIGEPIENSLQGSEINELDITNIMNDEMITVQKSIEDIENNKLRSFISNELKRKKVNN